MPVVRISLGRFDADILDAVRTRLAESQATLEPAIRAMTGSIAYYVALDERNLAMTNVSVWSTLEDAERMGSLPAMNELGASFAAMGVRFERPITNHDVLWCLGA